MTETGEKDKLLRARQDMVEVQLRDRGISDEAVLEAMRLVGREDFLPSKDKEMAYYDGPLSIGLGQTISQPYIVALMTQELKVNNHCSVLEIGTGSGYQTAILAKLAKEVYTIERHNELSEKAREVLSGLGITNVKFSLGDGSCGWSEDNNNNKKFDRIILTAAAADMPEPLIEQLAEGGIAIAPLGGENVQELIVMEKKEGKLKKCEICGCRFVRLIGKYGYEN